MSRIPPPPQPGQPFDPAADHGRPAHLPPPSRTDQVWSPPPRQRGVAWLAWLVILGIVVFAVVGPVLESATESPNPDDPLGLTLFEMQSKYLVGANEFTFANSNTADDPDDDADSAPDAEPADEDDVAGESLLYKQASETMNVGSIEQRQAFIILAAELRDHQAAAEHLADLHSDIDRAAESPGFTMRPDQEAVLDALDVLYTSDAAPAETMNALTDDERHALRSGLGWFGDLALAPAGGDLAVRDDVLASADRTFWIFIGVATAAAAGMFIGFCILVTFTVLALTGRLRSGLAATMPAEIGGIYRVPHGILAETFAIWLLLFVGIQNLVPYVLPLVSGHLPIVQNPLFGLGLTVAIFFGSLAVLIWPVLRGCPWRDVRHAIGLTRTKPYQGDALVEPMYGPVGYLLGLPLLGIGIICMLGLTTIQAMFHINADDPVFSSSAGPAHPIILQLTAPGILPKLLLLFVAAVCAPIVEEVMFRGVLFGHLRRWSHTWGTAASFFMSAMLSSFVFAIIHPQGWVAAPVLMSLAVAFCIMREWRGSLVAPIVIHAINNAIIVSIVIFMLNA